MALATPEQLRARGHVQVDLDPGLSITCRRLSRDAVRRQAATLGVRADDDDPLVRRRLIDACICTVARAPRIVPTDDASADAVWIGEFSVDERAEIFGHALGVRQRGYLAPFVPSPQPVVDAMLTAAGVTAADTVYDLGCGDGRIVMTAATQYGARGVGIDYDPTRLVTARAAATLAGVTDRVTFVQGDVQAIDLSPATVVTLYLLTRSNLRLLSQLRAQLAPGTRIVSHDFAMGDWAPETTTHVLDDIGRRHTIYRWTV